MDEPIIDFLQRRLAEARGDWPQIASDSGVPYGTVVNIAQGKVTNPTLVNVQRLIDYFRAKDTMLASLKKEAA